MSNKNLPHIKYFPRDSFYPNQYEAMEKIRSALLKQEIVLFEGACGTGKTLSALVPSLHVGKQLDKTVIIATNVHQQMVQFISEARDIKRSHDVKVAVLKGKMSMCPQEVDYDECALKRDNTYDLVEMEKEMALKKEEIKAASDNYKQSRDAAFIALRDELTKEYDLLEKKIHDVRKRSCDELYEVLKSDTGPFRQWLYADVRTPEEVADHAMKQGMCGYELLKREIKYSDLLICNYHHVLNPDIFSTVLMWLEKEPEDVIVIFDEAHNLEATARSHSSITLTERSLEMAIAELEANKALLTDDTFIRLFGIFKDTITDTYASRFKFGERGRVGRNWYDMRISDPYERMDGIKHKFLRGCREDIGDESKVQEHLSQAANLGDELDEEYQDQYKKGLSNILKRSHIRTAAVFLSSYLVLSENLQYYPILNVRRDVNNDIYGRIELFTCIPSNVTQPLFKSLYSAILMSATLRPFDMIKKTLGINRQVCELSYPTTFPEEKRLSIAVSIPPLFSKNRDDPQNLQTVENVILDAIEYTKGNVIVFFQSSFEAKRYFSKLEKSINVPFFLDEAGVSAQDVRKEFFSIGEKGGKAVLFSYLWGTLTEGVDYRDGRGRTVIVVGVGYTALNDRMNAVESAYDHVFEFGAGWEYAVLIPTIRKIRQAMGRVVRSPDDYGARILLDGRFLTDSGKRFGKFAVFNRFPEDEQAEIVDVDPEKVKYSLMNFFTDNT